MFALIELNNKKVEKELQQDINVHFIPAAIEGKGKINIEKHFNLYTRTDKNLVLTNALRGHPLVGEKVTLPTTSQTFILQEQMAERNSIDLRRQFQSINTISQFTYWSYDNNKENLQNFKDVLDFPQIAEVVCINILFIVYIYL